LEDLECIKELIEVCFVAFWWARYYLLSTATVL